MVGVAGSTAWRGWATTAAASAPSTRSRAPASGWAPAPARTSCPSHISKVRSPGPAPRVSSALCRERRHPEEARPVLPAGEGEVGGQAELLQPEQPGQPHQRPHDGRGRPRPRAQVRLQAGHLLLGCRENTEVTQWIPRRYSRGESTILMLNFIPSSLSTPSVLYLHLPSPLPLVSWPIAEFNPGSAGRGLGPGPPRPPRLLHPRHRARPHGGAQAPPRRDARCQRVPVTIHYPRSGHEPGLFLLDYK